MTKDIDFINNVNLHGYEIRDVSLYKVASVPAEATEAKKGQIVYVTGENAGFYYCDGSKWELITSETARAALATRLTKVEVQLGLAEGEGTPLTSRVDTLETTLLGPNKDGTAGVKKQTETNASNISDLQTAVDTNTSNITLNTQAIASINADIGVADIGTDVKIKPAIAALQNNDKSQDTKITALQTAVGNDSSGLVADVATLKTHASTYEPKVDNLVTVVTDASTGLVKKVADLDSTTLKTSQLVTTVSGTDDTKVPSEKAVAAYITTKLTGVYTFKGTAATADQLPASGKSGDVYNLGFAKDFEGKTYPVGTNWAYDEDSGAWEPLTGIFDTSGFQTTANLVKTNLDGNEVDKYPSVAVVKAAVDAKANATTTYTKTEVDDALKTKVDKLSVSDTRAGTYTKVTVNAEGQVTSGEEQITQDDISGTIDTTKITSFASKVREESHKEFSIAITDAGATVNHNLGLAHPHVSVYDGTSLVYAAVEIVDNNSVKVYGKSTNTTVTVVIS